MEAWSLIIMSSREPPNKMIFPDRKSVGNFLIPLENFSAFCYNNIMNASVERRPREP